MTKTQRIFHNSLVQVRKDLRFLSPKFTGLFIVGLLAVGIGASVVLVGMNNDLRQQAQVVYMDCVSPAVKINGGVDSGGCLCPNSTQIINPGQDPSVFCIVPTQSPKPTPLPTHADIPVVVSPTISFTSCIPGDGYCNYETVNDSSQAVYYVCQNSQGGYTTSICNSGRCSSDGKRCEPVRAPVADLCVPNAYKCEYSTGFGQNVEWKCIKPGQYISASWTVNEVCTNGCFGMMCALPRPSATPQRREFYCSNGQLYILQTNGTYLANPCPSGQCTASGSQCAVAPTICDPNSVEINTGNNTSLCQCNDLSRSIIQKGESCPREEADCFTAEGQRVESRNSCNPSTDEFSFYTCGNTTPVTVHCEYGCAWELGNASPWDHQCATAEQAEVTLVPVSPSPMITTAPTRGTTVVIERDGVQQAVPVRNVPICRVTIGLSRFLIWQRLCITPNP